MHKIIPLGELWCELMYKIGPAWPAQKLTGVGQVDWVIKHWSEVLNYPVIGWLDALELRREEFEKDDEIGWDINGSEWDQIYLKSYPIFSDLGIFGSNIFLYSYEKKLSIWVQNLKYISKSKIQNEYLNLYP